MGGRYRAFISYSHADAAAARWLHGKLETYRLPKGLGEPASLGADNRKLGPIFRDREDLAAAGDLSEAVKAALAECNVLVVLCTPEAKQSVWVAREIALFRQLHPDRPILAALFDGEPEEAFPPALTDGREPLAADLRKAGDGRRLGFLKVVAGIAGVPLDALVQRDAQRKMRRVMAVTLGSLAAALVMAFMTVIAIQSRNEAERQRAEAEGLVEFMLTDLRQELRGVGRLDVMDGVNERAMAYYDGQGDLSRFPADSLERRARVLLAMGEDEESLGNWPLALARFKEAHRTTLALLQREPENPGRIFAHAQSEYWVGYAAWQQKDLDQTERYWRGYLAQAEDLAAAEPGTVRSLMELGYANGNMCEVLTSREATQQTGIEHCRKAITFEQQAVALEPENIGNVMALANRYGWLADALVRVDEFDEALANRRQEQRLIDVLVTQQPLNVELRLRQSWPLIGMGELENARGRHDEAMRHLQAALARLEELAAETPGNGHVSAMRIRTIMLMAQARKQAGHADWQDYARKARQLFERTSAGATGEPVRRIEEMLEIKGAIR